jgi:TolB protein
MKKTIIATLLTTAAVGVLLAQDPPPTQPPQQQVDTVRTVITGGPGLPPRLAVPDFIAPGGDADTVAAAKLMGQVLWDDLNFEREFYLISRDTYRTIPPPPTLDRVPLDRWKELGADGLVVGSVTRSGKNLVVQVRLVEVNSGRSAFAKEYSGSLDNPRFFAHTISDEIHMDQRNLRGVARTKLAFTSNRDNERISGPIEARNIQNIYMSDYDGARQTRITITKSLDITPVWSPDARSIAYTSYRTGFPDIIVADIFGKRTSSRPARGNERSHNFLPVFSPDGTRIAFMSNRDGNPEIYVMNRDGSNVRRLTNHPATDVTPTWAPTGNQLAFTSDRTGRPQIWIMNADGSGQQRITSETWCDRPTWSPAPFNEIAYASQAGGGYDIRIFDFATRSVKSITNGEGSNESPAFSPNGRHIAFSSSRAGKYQIFTIDRTGENLRQITRSGDNRFPNWSNGPDAR